MDLQITTFESRKAARGKRQLLTWESFVERMSTPVVTPETFAMYQLSKNDERTEIKDVGGYVGGTFAGNKRSKAAMQERCLLTVDADDASYLDVDNYSAMYDYKTFCHTTHSSSLNSVRLRWIFPLTRPVNSNEYRVLIHVVASWVGENTLDDSTDQPERLMFWPSISCDQHYSKWELGSEFIDPDELLNSEEGRAAAEAVAEADRGTVMEFVDDDGLQVPEGHRNKQLFSFAASLRQHGLDEGGIRTILAEYNDRYCHPPVEDWELDLLTNSVCTRYTPGERVAPSLRDAWDDFADLGEPARHIEAGPKVLGIHAETLKSLMERDLPPIPWVVDDLLCEGLAILASPPKFGKSWMAYHLGLAVTSGTDFLGFKTHKTGVAYLALEDSDHRLKDRATKLMAEGLLPDGKIPDNLYLIKEAPALDDGLLDHMNTFLESVNNSVGLIIIDTLQKIRGKSHRSEGVYGYDYRELGLLHQWALDHHIALVVVHHLAKGVDTGDFVERLNGSMGVSGAADTIITLTRVDRRDENTVMHITGRDVMDKDYVLAKQGVRWINLGEKKDYDKQKKDGDFALDPVAKAIRYQLDEQEDMAEEGQTKVTWKCTSDQLRIEAMKLYGDSEDLQSSTAVGKHVKAIAGRLEASYGITYTYLHTSDYRGHLFTREIV